MVLRGVLLTSSTRGGGHLRGTDLVHKRWWAGDWCFAGQDVTNKGFWELWALEWYTPCKRGVVGMGVMDNGMVARGVVGMGVVLTSWTRGGGHWNGASASPARE